MSIGEMGPAMTAYICILAAVAGAVFGSFINCAAWRIAHGENFLKGRSHCAECGHVLGIGDLIPVISYLALKGKCRYCGKKISPRYMLTELFLAAAFVLLVLRYGASGEAVRYMGFAVILLGLSLVDLETYRIPNGFLIAGIVWWAVTIPFVQPGLFGREGSFFQPSTLFLDTGVSTLSGLLGGFLIAGIMLLMALVFDKVSGKESLGGGDIKLLFVVGLYLGFACSFFNLILSCILGLVFVAAMKKKRIPFGPAISLAAYVTLLIGSFVINWYIGLF